MHKREQGFLLLSLLITIGVLSAIFLLMAEGLVVRQIRAQAEPFKERMMYIKEQINGYQLTKYQESATNINGSTLFPRTLDDLSPNYIPTCSNADNQNGLCAKTAQTPWGTNMTYKVNMDTTFFPPRYYAELTLALPSRADDNTIREYNVYADVLSVLPGIRFSADEQSLIWKIPRLVDIPNFETVIAEKLKDYIKDDGTTQLTADWDVGNQSILNAKKVTVQTQNGRQQQLGLGTVKEFLGKHRQKVYKNSYSCAVGLVQTIHVSLNAPMAPNSTTEYIGLVGFKPYAIDEGTYWSLGLDYNAKIKSTGKWEKMHSGYLNVRLNCSQ